MWRHTKNVSRTPQIVVHYTNLLKTGETTKNFKGDDNMGKWKRKYNLEGLYSENFDSIICNINVSAIGVTDQTWKND